MVTLCGHAATEGRIVKFVPASGAASRMFRDLLYYQRQEGELSASDIKRESRLGKVEAGEVQVFLDNLERFAFHDDLHRTLAERHRFPDQTSGASAVKPVLDALLSPGAMHYGDLADTVE